MKGIACIIIYVKRLPIRRSFTVIPPTRPDMAQRVGSSSSCAMRGSESRLAIKLKQRCFFVIVFGVGFVVEEFSEELYAINKQELPNGFID